MKIKNRKIVLKIIIIIIILSILPIIFIYKNLKYYKLDDRLINVENFQKKQTGKVKGWLRIQGTDIDIPIIYAYTSYSLNNPEFEIGWTELDYNKLPSYLSISSHNIRNLSSHPLIANKKHRRFEQLMSFVYYDFSKKNKYIQYTTNGKNYIYKIYAVYFMKEDDVDKFNLKGEQLKKHINKALKKSIFKYNVSVDDNDKIISLSTCTRFANSDKYSFVVEARKLRTKELINDYSVKKRNNYKKIEEVLNEGDD